MPLFSDAEVGLSELQDGDVGLSNELTDSDLGIESPQFSIKEGPYDEPHPSGLDTTTDVIASMKGNPFAMANIMLTPLTAAGKGVMAIANAPTDISNRVRGATPSSPNYTQPLDAGSPNPFEIPKLSDDDVKTLGIPPSVKGVHDAVIDTLNGLTEPESALTLPLLGLENVSKPATAAFAAQLATGLPDSIKNIADANTAQEKAHAWASAAIQAIMLKSTTEHALTESPAEPSPNNSTAVAQPTPKPPAPSISKPLATIGDLTGSALDKFRPQGAKPTEWANPDYVPPDIEAAAKKPVGTGGLPLSDKMQEQLNAADIHVSPGITERILGNRIKSPLAFNKLFPNLNLSLEQAQEVLNQVWKKSDNVPEKYLNNDANPTESKLDALPVDDLAKLKHGDGIAYGLTLSPDDVPRLQAKYDAATKQMVAAAGAQDQPAMTAAFGKANFYGGALMGATKGEHPISGSNYSRYIADHPYLEKTSTPEINKEPITAPALSPEPPLSVESSKTETPSSEPVKEETAPNKPIPQPESESSTFGVAERVREKMGDTTPSGEGVDPEISVESGRQRLANGENPEAAMAEFEKSGKIDRGNMELARAQGEKLYKAAVALEDKPESPEYIAAKKASDDWNARTKKMQTVWAASGHAQQGETDVDTGSFTSMAQEFKKSSGKDFTPEQSKAAQEKVKASKKASGDVVGAQSKLFDEMTKDEPSTAPKSTVKKVTEKLDSIADAAWKRIVARHKEGRSTAGLDPTDLADHVIYGAAKISKGVVNKAAWVAEMARDLGEYVRPHLNDIYDASKKWIAEHQDTIGADSLHNIEAGKKFTPEQVKSLWKRAKAMVDSGDAEFDDVRYKLAQELGIPVKDVTEALAQPKNAKRMTDEMYRKMSEHRRIVQNAKDWLQNAKYPGWLKFARSIPRAFFAAKVFGHGTVGMITHAGINIFNPLAWKTYWPNFFRQYKLMFDRGYHEKMMQDLVRDPLYIKARRAGLNNDPTKFSDEYQKGAIRKIMGHGLAGKVFDTFASGRGFDALKLFRQAQFNQAWNRLPPSLKTPEMAKLIADGVNHATGTVQSQFPQWASEAAGTAFFAPKLEASRWQWMIGDTARSAKTVLNWRNETLEARNAAMADIKQKAAIAGTLGSLLAINQGLLKAAGSKQNVNLTDTKKSDYLAFKVDGENVGIAAPMIGIARLLHNLWVASNATKFGQKGVGETLTDYTRGKLSPFAGFAADTFTGTDFQKRPLPFSDKPVPKYLQNEGEGKYGVMEYGFRQAAPIPFQEAVMEVWKHQGMNDSTAERFWKALVLGVSAGSTGARVTPDWEMEKEK